MSINLRPNSESECDPHDVAIKSFFLGPSAENSEWLIEVVRDILHRWFDWRKNLNPHRPVISSKDRMSRDFQQQQNLSRSELIEIARRFENEIPKFLPQYIGHMFSEISMPALLGHLITLLHNPNNIAPEASHVGLEIERAAVQELVKMVGYSGGVGHFTSGGTVANLEFLFRARERLALWLAREASLGTNQNLTRAAACGWQRFQAAQGRVDPELEKRLNILESGPEAFFALREQTGREVQRPILFVSGSKHYSWPKAMHMLGLSTKNLKLIELDEAGRARPRKLKLAIEEALRLEIPILGVVNIAGTTELGSMDPLDETAEVLEHFRKQEDLNLWFHVDAAYGGFFRTLWQSEEDLANLPGALRSALSALPLSDSVTLDPHKLGYVPYSSGTFLCRENKNYFVRSFSGPYLAGSANSETEMNIGNYTIEGSRSAAGAVATYASMKSFASQQGYARVLNRTLQVKKLFQVKLAASGLDLFFPEGLDSNIICFTVANDSNELSEINQRAISLYEKIEASHQFWVSKTTLERPMYQALIEAFCRQHGVNSKPHEGLVLLRLTLMNPFLVTKESELDHLGQFCQLLKGLVFPQKG